MTGGAVVTIAVAVRANTHLGLPPSVSADDWGTHCLRHPSPPMTGGGIVAVAAVVHLRRRPADLSLPTGSHPSWISFLLYCNVSKLY
jgi:hypothetical protein